MAKSGSNRSGGTRSNKGSTQGTGKSRGAGGWPSKTYGKPSGGGRKNAPPKGKGK